MSTAAPSEAVTELYREHRSWLQGWLRYKLGCVWEAADLIQDTFIHILASPSAGSELAALRAPPTTSPPSSAGS